MEHLPNCYIIGTGEYVSGYVDGSASGSDKKIGVVALTLFDLRRRGFVGNITLIGTNGTKFEGIRSHFEKNIQQVYNNMDVSFHSFPADDVLRDTSAYLSALDGARPGDLCFIFTPDDLHYDMIKAALERDLHVLVTKPALKILENHLEISRMADEKNLLVSVEVHKRWDPMYADSRQRIRTLGDFGYFNSYMSQPKSQLVTFKSWAGKSSDISYYLNSHHIDFHTWSMDGIATVESVTAYGSTGVASSAPYNCDTEDTITIVATWKNKSSNKGTAIYTASWVSPTSDVHSQQRFHYMGHNGEMTIDQAHRGYYVATDNGGYHSLNPLYMKYTPDSDGNFAGQNGYGYKSIDEFVQCANQLRKDPSVHINSFDERLATIRKNAIVTAILEAGRRSLDNNGAVVSVEYDEHGIPSSINVVE